MGKAVLFKRFLQHPTQVGALCPSSCALCRAMASEIGVENAGLVVELGPGTGVITRELVRRLPENGKLLAVELDELLCEHLKRTFPEVEICHDSASNLGGILKERGLPPVNAVVSGLPWAVFPESLQREILGALVENLSEGGYFATFAYLQGLMLPAGIRFRKLLNELFSEVTSSRVVWKNLPPALVYPCRK